MSRERGEGLAQRLEPSRAEAGDDQATLAVRLAHVERAYGELLERVRHYEHERAEIKSRLKRILASIGASGSA